MKATIANLPSELSEWDTWKIDYHFTTREAAAFTFATEKPVPPKMGGAEFRGVTLSGKHSANLLEVFFSHDMLWQINAVDTRKNGILKIAARSVASLQDLIELVPIP
jgi:hypothetical protein